MILEAIKLKKENLEEELVNVEWKLSEQRRHSKAAQQNEKKKVSVLTREKEELQEKLKEQDRRSKAAQNEEKKKNHR